MKDMLHRGFIFSVLMGVFFLTCSQTTQEFEETVMIPTEEAPLSATYYKDEMRAFVIEISRYAKEKNPEFSIIPQNGIELVTLDGAEEGVLAVDYLNAIDGHGQESLWYGDPRDNSETGNSRTRYLLSYLEKSQAEGNAILVTDYCRTTNKITTSINNAKEKGFTHFVATERELNVIPTEAYDIPNENANDIVKLTDAKNHLFFLNYSAYPSKTALLGALQATNYDVLIIDVFFATEQQFTVEDITALKTKANGGKRKVIAYMSIGEAEDYRFYWDNNWDFEPPVWLSEENPDWPGNFKVKYWEQDWQNTIIYNQNSYLNLILSSQFDGVYLDIIDAFEFFED
ncbi:endo alpha-1,4 polygalactosaminidase [Flavobacterium sp. ASW18X]|uniref:endo alpha-1,4 polygalactosaminidase n=1 Tax=Flavobacterium sp. ASW18X TaxID=2572595 RepID=UPI001F0E941B|nr:endo alpha-1,4 polygalactosaminidase [Flavobacterium sp. ASW18X]